MGDRVHVPAALSYAAGPPTTRQLQERRDALKVSHDASLEQVSRLALDQARLSEGLGEELAGMQTDGLTLTELEARERETGILAALSRTLNRRRTVLARRSVGESLLRRYEAASQRLRESSAFCDELRLCGLDLQAQVDGLHVELGRVREDARAAAGRVVALDEAMDAIDAGASLPEGTTRAQLRERVAFDERTQAAALDLLRARERLLAQELGPARELRDTVLTLHEELSRFVLKATSAVDTSGRQIQALGMAADAPTVVAELHDSLAELGTAMQATERYVRAAQQLVGDTLPRLSAELEADQGLITGVIDAESLDRAQARALADQALRQAAEAEVAAIGSPDS